MPQVIGIIVDVVAGWLEAAGVGAVLAEAIATVVAYAVVMAPLYLYNAAQARKGMSSGSTADTGRTFTVRQPAANRNTVYGKVQIGGLLVYVGSSGNLNEFLHLIIVHAAHQCQAIDTILFDGVTVPLDGSGNATGTFAGYAIVKVHLGGPGQVVDPTLTAAMTEWNSTCVGNGICYSYVQLKHNPTLFPTGIPNVSVIMRGKLVYDPRSSTTAYSANAALCLRDYLLDAQLGLGAQAAEIDDTASQVAANHCDEAVSLAAGGTENRYECNGVVDSGVAPGSVITDLCAAMAGSCPYIAGLFTIRAGVYYAADSTITDDDLRSPLQLSLGDSMRVAFNGVKGTYISPANNWQVGDIPPYIKQITAGAFVVGQVYCIVFVGTTSWTSIGAASNTLGVVFVATGVGSGTGIADPYLGEDGGQRVWQDLVLNFTSSPSMAMRLEKIALEHSRRDKTMNFPGKLTLLNIKVGDTTQYSSTRYGWSSKTFEVINTQFRMDSGGNGGAPILGMDLSLRETDSHIFDWTTAEEQSLPATPLSTLPNYYSLATSTPTSPTVTQDNLQNPDGTTTARLKVVMTTPTDASVFNGGVISIEYKKTADSTWLVWSNDRGDTTTDYLTNILPGVSYDVRYRYKNVLGVFSLYSATVAATTSVTAVATPSLSPAGGQFTTSVTVTATCATSGATIRYTTDGSAVNNTSPSFPGGGVTITVGTTFRVKAFNGNDTSAEISVTFTLNSSTPTCSGVSISFNPPSNTTLSSTAACTMSCATPSSTIHYTVNGGATLTYSTTFTTNAGDVLVAWATATGYTQSGNNTATYTHL